MPSRFVELKARVVQSARSSAGETVGYGANLDSRDGPTRLAIVSAGYGPTVLSPASGSRQTKQLDSPRVREVVVVRHTLGPGRLRPHLDGPDAMSVTAIFKTTPCAAPPL